MNEVFLPGLLKVREPDKSQVTTDSLSAGVFIGTLFSPQVTTQATNSVVESYPSPVPTYSCHNNLLFDTRGSDPDLCSTVLDTSHYIIDNM